MMPLTFQPSAVQIRNHVFCRAIVSSVVQSCLLLCNQVFCRAMKSSVVHLHGVCECSAQGSPQKIAQKFEHTIFLSLTCAVYTGAVPGAFPALCLRFPQKSHRHCRATHLLPRDCTEVAGASAGASARASPTESLKGSLATYLFSS